ncbi:MAG: hypothetical protein PHE83_17515, partial [Opitutaceae bacterium]|nr:hypothetical protein [Opitutaceae bacterium]
AHRDRFLALAPALEPAILADGETLMLYLSWAQQMKVALPLPFAQYRACLIRDPLHGILWSIAVGDRDFSADLLEWAGSHTHEYAAAAWTVSVAEAIDPEPFRPVLSLNPKYAVAASATFGMRFALDDFHAPLDGRWLYLLLANDGCEDPEAAERQLLTGDPAWGLEWLIEQDKCADRRRMGLIIAGLRAWTPTHPLYDSVLCSLEELSRQRTGEPSAPAPPAAEPGHASGKVRLLNPVTGLPLDGGDEDPEDDDPGDDRPEDAYEDGEEEDDEGEMEDLAGAADE